jgi:hypothetical protein
LTRINEGLQGLAADAPVSIDGGDDVNKLDYPACSGESTTGTLPSGIVSWYTLANGATEPPLGQHVTGVR